MRMSLIIEEIKGLNNCYVLRPKDFVPPKKLYIKRSFWTCSICNMLLIDENKVKDYFKNHVDENGYCLFEESNKKGIPNLNMCIGIK